ncbi:MAG: hypothetical protein JST93_04005 [Acidobacteria bacterium]|nr:hypothetical protein [Acidobacteriota bacterium]
MEDHIVEEVRRIREEHAAKFNYDIDAIFADYKRLEAESSRRHLSFGPRRTAKPAKPLGINATELLTGTK